MSLKLLVVNDFTHLGGAELVLLDFLRYLKDLSDDWKIQILTNCPGPFSEAAEEITNNPANYIDFSKLKRNWRKPVEWRKTGLEISRLLLQFSPDLILCNSLWAAIIVKKQLKNTGIPIVCAVHAAIQPKRRDKKFFFHFAGSLLLRGIDGWIVVSKALSEELISLKVSSDKIKIIPNGVCIPEISALTETNKWRNKLNISSDTVLIASLGRLHPGKGQQLIVEAFAEIVSEHQNSFLVIGGEEIVNLDESHNFTSLLKQQICDYNLQDRVLLAGFVHDATALLSETDILISASAEESFGLSILEGMAAGCAVVASDVGGHRNLICNDNNGILYDPDKKNALTNAVCRLISDKKLRLQFGMAAREKALQFDLKITMSKWVNYLEHIAGMTDDFLE